MQQKAAILLYPGCIFFEVALAAEVLATSMEVVFYTPDGDVHCSSAGAIIAPAGSYRAAEDLAEEGTFSVVLVPGGDPASIIPGAMASRVLRSARSKGAVIGGICAGVLVIASAGLLVGVRTTHNYTSAYASEEAVAFTQRYWVGSVFEPADVVCDQSVVSAMPWAYVEFAAVIATSLGVLSTVEALAFIDRYKRIGAEPTAQVQALLASVAHG